MTKKMLPLPHPKVTNFLSSNFSGEVLWPLPVPKSYRFSFIQFFRWSTLTGDEIISNTRKRWTVVMTPWKRTRQRQAFDVESLWSSCCTQCSSCRSKADEGVCLCMRVCVCLCACVIEREKESQWDCPNGNFSHGKFRSLSLRKASCDSRAIQPTSINY